MLRLSGKSPITPEPDVTGNIGIHSPVPTNNTIRYIKVKVFNDDQVEREVEIIQYPLEYIINIQSWYSYRDDFKTNNARPTTYEYMGDQYIRNQPCHGKYIQLERTI